jgi:adenylosuccinate synthase
MDLVALQFACMLNGVTQIVMTKADVLDAFEELSICTSYKINGRETSEIPFQMSNASIEPQYKTFEGWKMETSQMREEKNLPGAMKSYIDFINKNLTAKVRYISNGPGRDQIIKIQ